MRAVIIMSMALVLTGCQTTEPTVVIKEVERPVEIPDQLRRCDPVVPAPMATQASAAKNLNRYALGLRRCMQRHDRTIELIDQHNTTVSGSQF
ncbi:MULTISPECIES: hypothetical protein [unclassified Ensifer]|uniref:hypothetical protein n=1 Tax=unclassified Ensifer TaxID=2633371 RepID=UPI0008131585|nr:MULTISPECIES: hypothetical protein [unclassified Ensifer]OCP08001.1 hypothetical protein BC362_10345 [Ensifer sp. LC14]OCP10889.1 hypothetical protein BC374_17620 [Ensifer sp. LC13]OCP11565.1 hypothetical protein BBX50_18235 [Ensifer sp. LC11]OCP33384.1 hypothetical protein BC364_17125 [Ensifer sp. LC499]